MIDREQIREAVASIILAIGEDPKREGLVDTPRRVADAYEEFFSGLDQDPSEVLATSYEEGHTELVVLKDIPFVSLCEHHLLPFYGNAAIGYVPSGRVVGVSKLARALDVLARRPQLQERLTRQLADCILSSIEPEGVAVVLSAEHLCVSLRGVKKGGSRLVTSATRGTVRTRDEIRRELHAMIREG